MFTRFDTPIFVCAVLLMTVGLLAIYSATAQQESPSVKGSFARQGIWVLTGVVVGAVATILPFRVFERLAYVAYGLALLALVAVLFLGQGTNARWFAFGPARLQPSEFAKVAVVLALARFLSGHRTDVNSPKDILLATGLVALPTLLVLKQPDMGTALVFMGMLLPLLYWAGLRSFTLFLIVAPAITALASFQFWTFLLAMLGLATVLYFSRRGRRVLIFNLLLNLAVGILAPLVWSRLAPYQQNRILAFLGLHSDPRGVGYQVIQSKVAIGSGGLLGKGFMQGSQTQLRFLPEQHTDFIFSVIGEEFGLVGSLFVLTLFFVLLTRALRIAATARNPFTSMVVAGAVTVLGIHVIVNIGVTLGIMPVTGLPLPFVSYGGSSLWTFAILVGLVLNGSLHRLDY
ncbi:MAG: rod shape-determining protein RodA [candidate division KSB1 bacterium]|nr:rod shape-determining protein RodA [candidate division KSB1 bacterium]